MGLLENKTCIVTGAAGSLGLASVRRFVEEGARVMLVDRDRDRLNDALKTLPEGRATAMLADVASSRDTAAYVNATVARWGPIDVLFSNAGISGVIRPVTEYPEEIFDAVMAVNLKGSFLACKYALPQMRDGGSIVMTSSVVGVTSDPGIAAYAASKHGLIGLMRTVAKEAAARRIRVNVVAPGPIDNGFQREVESGLSVALGTDAGKFLDSVIPLGRHAGADEVARSVLFLASDQSAFTTGSVVMADGGMHI
ncbi:MAG: SDR family oxidoreductase [Reyranella sp.]|uniref:SDR family NAD(P)-dependent oxidoreductase n=1 Tax=Reyranella sp. TaxID=1929291 RepID=UPI0025EE0339|nr:SDR family NAD(P)-dependent oxidoreductase [Reyranella sp.]MBR2813709.1 SDR family oxidoreductase [Reyranella sp.]